MDEEKKEVEVISEQEELDNTEEIIEEEIDRVEETPEESYSNEESIQEDTEQEKIIEEEYIEEYIEEDSEQEKELSEHDKLLDEKLKDKKPEEYTTFNKPTLIIIAIVFIILYSAYFIFTRDDKNKKPDVHDTTDDVSTSSIEKNIEDDTQSKAEYLGCYKKSEVKGFDTNSYPVLLTSKTFSNFENLDFSNKTSETINDKDYKYYIENGEIVYESTSETELKEYTTEDITNVISIKLSCYCDKCESLYYLTTDKSIYKIDLKDGYLYLDNSTNKPKIEEVIKEEAASFALSNDSTYVPSTCGGQTLIYKDTNGNILLDKNKTKNGNINEYQRHFLSNTNYGIYLYNKDNKNITEGLQIIKDNDKNIIYYQNAYLGYMFDCDITKETREEYSNSIYIVSEDYYLYIMNGKTSFDKSIAYKYSDSKISNINIVSESNITISFEDNSNLNILLSNSLYE